VSGNIEAISAVTLLTTDMPRAVEFYERLGFGLLYGGPTAAFTSFAVGLGFLNLQLDATRTPGATIWGRVVFWVDDVDAAYARVVQHGYATESEPADAPWGERYFHVRDPDGHELSFARPI
jgi:catechol 2,3-dioxygenase-like lactoylglutathione lyase family enzyme